MTTVSIATDRLGDQESSNEERLDLVLEVEMPHVHSYKAVVTAPTCTEGGYTTYTCDCGESYIAEETPALGHDWDGSGCTRCDAARENPFVDVPEGSFYYDAVLWAAQEGIAAGLDATHFGPNAACTRAQVVTFLWRSQGSPTVDTEVSFTDVQPGPYYTAAVAWALEKGITHGVGDNLFGLEAVCNRAQVVTFLHRTKA